MAQCKIFCIGLHKTGTTSLEHALGILGYRVISYDESVLEYVYSNDIGSLISSTDRADAFSDSPWYLYFREFHQAFPDAKFIFTQRSNEKWIKSVVNHFGDNWQLLQWKQFHEFVYGTGEPLGNEEIYLKKYQRHNSEVLSYFEGKPNFLHMNFSNGDGWEMLCEFLEKPIPDVPFPHSNKRPYTNFFQRVKNIGRYILRRRNSPWIISL